MDPATLAKHAIEAVRKPFTLKEALMSVADFRINRRKKFPLFEILMIAVCAMIDGAKGPTFGVASLRSVSAASVQQFSVQREADGDALITGCWLLAAGYWLLVVGTLRPQAVPKSAWSSPSSATRAQGRRLQGDCIEPARARCPRVHKKDGRAR